MQNEKEPLSRKALALTSTSNICTNICNQA